MAIDEKRSDVRSDKVDIPEYSMEEMGISSTREEVADALNQLELELYEDWRMEFARWAFHMGKDPHFFEGYSKKSMYNIMNRVEKFVAWVHREKGFTTDFTSEHLDEYWNTVLRPNDNQTASNRREINNASLVVKHKGEEYEIPKSEKVYRKINRTSASGFEDYLSARELEAVITASLRVYSAPNIDEMTEEEQDKWAAEYAERLGMPKHELIESGFQDATSYKIPSLVYASRDVGFRPSEVEESRMSWLRLDDEGDARFQIPKQEDSKDGKNNWRCYLSPESARLLDLWCEERAQMEKYDGRDEIWLTRKGTPYKSNSLRKIMGKLMNEAGIERDDREQGWYMIRRGVGTEVANSQGLSAVMSQLRINNIETARRYVQNDEPSIREWMATR